MGAAHKTRSVAQEVDDPQPTSIVSHAVNTHEELSRRESSPEGSCSCTDEEPSVAVENGVMFVDSDRQQKNDQFGWDAIIANFDFCI